ncbi:MAG: hypothetical protein COZ15_05280 [Elusimicrobia bacterium CG_4_10_14_3_um_filter_49_12_50_7]|nr:MAG: hypothetical protein COS41_03300 [Elusimicrobia bacterium CG03_land_8_20_14_0_80_50_18]PIX15914.1 MAG: hypothetical protein COZ72_02365 [Elusimicrobia bacterium CG_4_8_14_3_um_filter_50_9]PIY16581.1 MAG: hypothetical protein COZ15_05280 [Elusimicrobia bacterium CG_4_10_14_3_um_filter_49_12_50_7]
MVKGLSDFFPGGEEGQAMTEYILMMFLVVLSVAQVLRAFGLCLDIALIQSARKLGGFGGTIK